MLKLIRPYVLVSGVIALLVGPGPATGQESTTGSIAGSVVDGGGAAIPGATVTVTSERGRQVLVSDASGRFFAPYLVPDRYSVRVELQGFASLERKDVEVRLGQRSSLEFVMTNPNFGYPTNGGGSLAPGYQAPLHVRLGARFEW